MPIYRSFFTYRFAAFVLPRLITCLTVLWSLSCAWWTAAIAAETPMGPIEARVLLERTGFAPATPEDGRAFAALSRERAVDRLLASVTSPTATPPPWDDTWVPRSIVNAMDADAKKAFGEDKAKRRWDLRLWWSGWMTVTPSPLLERMTLFWHGHFANSIEKVDDPTLMYRQNIDIRPHAIGKFDELLRATLKSPAMLVYIDQNASKKSAPNENMAREFLELFTLGAGHFREDDMRDTTRALTGWNLDWETGHFKVDAANHDTGTMRILDRDGNFVGDDVIDIVLQQATLADTVTAKLWREFVASQPNPREIHKLAQRFRDSGWDIRTLMRGLLLEDALSAPENRGTLVKSPVELVIGTFREFGITAIDWPAVSSELDEMGQSVFAPPNVRGWLGGNRWLNATTLLRRLQFLDRLVDVSERPPMDTDKGMDSCV